MLNELFKEEIALIADRAIRAVVVEVLEAAPSDYGTRPSSRTGKHHPIQQLGAGGLARHVKAAVYFCDRISKAYGLIDRERDYCIAAVILHDIGKCLCTDETFTQHDRIGQEFILSVTDKYEAKIISQLVLAHTGIWGSLGKQPLDSIFRFTKLEQVVHLSDYVSAQEHVVLDFLPGVTVEQTSPISAMYKCSVCGDKTYILENSIIKRCCNLNMLYDREKDNR